MRFEAIDSYKGAWRHMAIPGNVDNLIHDFSVKSWSALGARKLSTIERALTDGNAIERRDDFHETRSQCIDHAAFFRRTDGRTFLLTMPYADGELFNQLFDEVMSGYRAKKAEIRDGVAWDAERYRCKTWSSQINSDADIRAVIVDNRYKPRKNGDMAAIIATAETLEEMGLLR